MGIDGLKLGQWLITCLRFAPNAPQQNPVEDIYLDQILSFYWMPLQENF